MNDCVDGIHHRMQPWQRKPHAMIVEWNPNTEKKNIIIIMYILQYTLVKWTEKNRIT